MRPVGRIVVSRGVYALTTVTEIYMETLANKLGMHVRSTES